MELFWCRRFLVFLGGVDVLEKAQVGREFENFGFAYSTLLCAAALAFVICLGVTVGRDLGVVGSLPGGDWNTKASLVIETPYGRFALRVFIPVLSGRPPLLRSYTAVAPQSRRARCR